MIQAVISDFGGVLTAPFVPAFVRAHAEMGIPLEAIGTVMARAGERGGDPPLYALERGELAERDFVAGLAAELSDVLGRPVDLDGYGRRLMAHLEPNRPLFDYYRELRGRGVRMALLTNNVREWEPLWRPMLPIDEVFELVVDSAFVGMRKPEPRIYELTLERLRLPPEACAFVDDLALNVDAARDAGMHGLVFESTTQLIRDLEPLLGD